MSSNFKSLENYEVMHGRNGGELGCNDTNAIMLVIIVLTNVVLFLNLIPFLFCHIALRVTLISTPMTREH